MSDPERDEDLVRRYLEGDQSAFASLVERHETRVYNLCLRILGDPDDAHDAAQETFLTALRKLSQFRGDAAFTTWLHRVGVNACYDGLRKQRRRPMLRLIDDDDREPEPGPPAPDHADEIAATLDVSRALASIPEEFRIAVVLADVQDVAYEEIARILDVPVGTVKSRVHRGRLALARALGLEGGRAGRGTSPGPTVGGREPAAPLPTSEKES